MKYKARTLFDITATKVTGHFKSSLIPFQDHAGQSITDLGSWEHARNQQRNWETLTQLINLRTQIEFLSDPIQEKNLWSFEFVTETEIFNNGSDPVGILKSDADGVPMLRELNNDPDIGPVLVTSGPKQNIWFELLPINNALENTDG